MQLLYWTVFSASYLASQLICCAPVSKEQYRLPTSVLQALSNRGTLILESALKTALQALEGAVKEQSLRQQECGRCTVCLFPECRSLTTQCRGKGENAESEPTCEAILIAEKETDPVERSWALSAMCNFYQHLCTEWNHTSENCINIMAGQCHLKLQECKLESDMDYLNTSPDWDTSLACGQAISSPNNTIPKGRIVGGSVTSPGSWPWLVNIRVNGELMCGGVLLGDVWVLTAAHCFNGNINELHWTVVVGEYNLNEEETGKKVYQVNRIITHPKFNQKTFNNDLALVELTSTVTSSSRAIPVCLPSVPVEPSPGTSCYIAGWGSLYEDGPPSDVIMEARVPVLSQESCRSTLGKDMLTNTMFCAGYLSGGIDSCQGDSGGPLTCQDPSSKQYVIYGITSWGDGCGERGKPGVYTRVTAFIDWIRTQMKKSTPSREPSCFELGAMTDSQQNNPKSEMSPLCSFYKQSCPAPFSPRACTRLAEEKCRQRQRRCELRSYLQVLLNLLRKAEEFLRNNMDLSFFTQTIPQFMEDMYSDIFPHRAQRDLTEQNPLMNVIDKEPNEIISDEINKTDTTIGNDIHRELQITSFEVLFTDLGPRLDDWTSFLYHMVVQGSTNIMQKKQRGKEFEDTEEQLFLEKNDDAVEELKEKGRQVIHNLKSQLRSDGIILTDDPLLLDQGVIPVHYQPQKRDVTSVTGATKENVQGCPHLSEAINEVQSIKEKYKWILQIPERDLSMKFQEILVDLGSKNEKGLYLARVRVCVAGKSSSFISLVGVDSSSLYRSMPGLIALSMDRLKT
ncbi:serine protease 56 isoform X2 [Bufo gargarizans]|uniref:serine protease 56 isoform X2 n=2 Tax=Bufo gargarizans TaxID=30331 RepID=UPI001CF52000|nr:serine protease 56 isoform X2 [Bufo gargarizans]